MGDGCGPLSYLLNYSLASRTLSTIFKTKETKVRQLSIEESFFKVLSQIMSDSLVDKSQISWNLPGTGDMTPQEDIHFIGGLVGYVGYEMKSESLSRSRQSNFITKSAVNTPDCSFLFADRLIIFDHELKQIFLSVLYDEYTNEEQIKWAEEMQNRISELETVCTDKFSVESASIKPPAIEVKSIHCYEAYLDNVSHSLDKISKGESYEVCLTTQLIAPLKLGASLPSPYKMYQHLRKNNPAPYGAFLSFKDTTVASSSPERFMYIDNNNYAIMKPIKGTISRATRNNFDGSDAEIEVENLSRIRKLSTGEKEAAENLMV